MNCEACNSEITHQEDFGNAEISLCVECAGSQLVKDYPQVLNKSVEHAPDGSGTSKVEFKTRLLGVDKDGYGVYYRESSSNKILYVCPMNSSQHNRHDEVIQENLRYNKSVTPGGPASTTGDYLTMNTNKDHIQLTKIEEVNFRKDYKKLASWIEDNEWAALSDFSESIL